MEELLTISKQPPGSKSQDYDFLREKGLEHVQRLAGKIWTDHNTHDPGITILEILCYAITDLGYRSSYDIADLVTPDPNNVGAREIQNFFTARQILPNAPVTINDYRKLMIDVQVHADEEGCEEVGIKNAWMDQALVNECPVYVHRQESQLSLEPDPQFQPTPANPTQMPLSMGVLYNVLLEFEKCDTFGDLNENNLTTELVIEDHPLDRNLEGTVVKVTVDFPRWDDASVDFDEDSEIKWGISKIDLQFLGEPGGYDFQYEIVDQVVVLSGTRSSSGGQSEIPGLAAIQKSINDFIYLGDDSMLGFYRRKVNKIGEIIHEVRHRLHAHRNLCEDFLQFSALRVEKIAVCADITLDLEADVEIVQAQIFHEIGKFLSPTVNFYSLEEMLDKCREEKVFGIARLDPVNQLVRVGADLTDMLAVGDQVTISNTTSNNQRFTVQSLRLTDDEASTLLTLEEPLEQEVPTGSEQLSFEIIQENECLTVDEIFEGPVLEHGFIDDSELEAADRRKVIHVSDLIQIIMRIEGVLAVRSIQIGNIPMDDPDGTIPSRSVRWCLDLAFEKNYVPRLSLLDSKITYYKDQLPFKASPEEVEEMIEVLEDGERTPKLHDFQGDLPVPSGTFRDLERYESIQNDFPLTYGVGEEGLPQGTQVSEMRKAQTKQLKGFLLFFDQLLANYMSQLAHVKDLFSMNAEKDASGNFLLERTYHTQSLIDQAPNVTPLYVDAAGHEVTLQELAEDDELFGARKNKFLDHLMARFSEQFTDYALLTFKMSGELKAPEELIEDKLSFLNRYPQISAERGLGINPLDPCRRWHPENCSGLEQRVSLLVGIEEPTANRLLFHPRIQLVAVSGGFEFTVEDGASQVLLKSSQIFATEDAAKLAIEGMIVNGCSVDQYDVETSDETNWHYVIRCADGTLAVSERQDFSNPDNDPTMHQEIQGLMEFFANEHFENVEANRKNLSCPFSNYFTTSLSYDFAADPPTYTVHFELAGVPFDPSPDNRFLTGSYTFEGTSKAVADIIAFDVPGEKVRVEGNIAGQLTTGDTLIITNSADNDGTYTVLAAANDGSDTEITINESLTSDNTPRGELRFNVESNAELEQLAEESISEVLWLVINNGKDPDRYQFDPSEAPYASPYVFQLTDRTGTVLGQSHAHDFNDQLATVLTSLPSGVLEIAGSSANDGTYTINSAAGRGPYVDLQLDPTLPDTIGDGYVVVAETYAFEVDLASNQIIVADDLSKLLEVGDQLDITGSPSNDGIYEITGVVFIGGETRFTLKEKIAADDNTGEATFTKSFVIDAASGAQLTIEGGFEHRAVTALTDFFTNKFFSNEGFHVLEHILLRPKVKGMHFVDVTKDTLTEGAPELGQLYYPQALAIQSVDAASDMVTMSGDLTGELDASADAALPSVIDLEGMGVNDGTYAITDITYDGVADHTQVTVSPSLLESFGVGEVGEGQLVFVKSTPITAVSSDDEAVSVAEPQVLSLVEDMVVEIAGSTDGVNDASYRLKEVVDDGGTQRLILGAVESEIADGLLDIVLEEDQCDACEIEDPYTCIVSVIAPHWQGRFDNMDYRKLMERRIRAEAPAHAFLNICWISCSQMGAFERAYKAWLLANSMSPSAPGQLSQALNALIGVIKQLRTVYPGGTLHDCEEDDTLQNSIILDNSVLGNA